MPKSQVLDLTLKDLTDFLKNGSETVKEQFEDWMDDKTKTPPDQILKVQYLQTNTLIDLQPALKVTYIQEKL